jgi:hypothetical protein
MAELRKLRPFFTMDTKLSEIPRDWLTVVEPRVVRGSFLPCWIWTGRLNTYGYPILNYVDAHTRKKTQMTVRRYVARIFWDLPEDWYVLMNCQGVNCVNPHHMYPSRFHPNHYMVKKDA